MALTLTLTQLQTIRDHILNDSVLNAFPNSADGNFEVAGLLNLQPDPNTWTIWRTNVIEQEIFSNGIDWTRVDNLSVGKARIWDWMFRPGSINPTKTTIRAGIDAVWAGTQADLDNRAAVYVHCKKLANRIQKVLSTGTGSVASPASLPSNIDELYEITPNEVEAARNS